MNEHRGIPEVVILILTAICICHVGVAQGKLRLTISQTSYVTEFGNPVSLNCQIFEDEQFPTVHVIWIINANENIEEKNVHQENPSLVIKNPTFENTGNYTCSASDGKTYVKSQPIELIVRGAIPSVIVELQSNNVYPGQTVTIQCTITASPKIINVYWQKKVNDISTNVTSNTQRVHGGTVDVPSLTVFSTRTNDSGLYTCNAQNLVGTGHSQYANLTVVGGIPVVSVGDGTVTAEYGHSVLLGCSITADPPVVTVYWQKEHDGIRTNITSTTPGIDGITISKPSLKIKEMRESDSGVYICYAVNAVGHAHSKNINLTVEGNMSYPLVQINYNRSIQVKYGGTFSIEANIRSYKPYPIREIYWQFINNGVVTRIDSKINGKYIDNASLIIKYVTTSESGQFTCFAANDVGSSKSNSIDVNVIGGEPIVEAEKTTYDSVYGKEVKLVCKIRSEPSVTHVYWEKVTNGAKTIINSGSVGYQGGTSENPSLIISYSSMYDSGNYTCLGTNVVGTSHSDPISLNIIGDLPEVRIPITNNVVNFGDSVKLVCIVTAKPNHDLVYWEHDAFGAIRRIFKDTVGTKGITAENPSLFLEYATTSFSGLYTCFAQNAVGIGHSSVLNVSVIGGLPDVTVDVRSYNTTYGKKTQLDCRVKAHPSVLYVYWQRERNNVITTLYKGSIGTEGISPDFPSLVLTRPVTSDAGIYTCLASNVAGVQKSLPTQLIVIGGIPTVSIKSNEYTVKYGEAITMECIIVSNLLITHVFWQRISDDGEMKRINSGTHGTSGGFVNRPSLTINFATPSDEGSYLCLVENAVGLGKSQSTKLSVLAGLPVVNVNLDQFVFRAGYSAFIHCSIISTITVEKVYWQIDINNSTIVINKDSSIMGIKGSTVHNPSLLIQKASVSMSGKYKCFATNAVGTASSAPILFKVVDTDSPIQTISVNVDIPDDDTSTILEGVFGTIGTLVTIATFAVSIWKIKQCRKDNKECKITDITDYDCSNRLMNKLRCTKLCSENVQNGKEADNSIPSHDQLYAGKDADNSKPSHDQHYADDIPNNPLYQVAIGIDEIKDGKEADNSIPSHDQLYAGKDADNSKPSHDQHYAVPVAESAA